MHTTKPCWSEAFAHPLQAFAEKGLSRSLDQALKPPHALDFASNNTLGLASHPAVVDAGAQSARRWGAGAGASRLVTQESGQLHELEQAVAELTSWPGAIYLNSGFMANAAIMETLSRLPGARFFLDHRAHASLFFAAKNARCPVYTFRHGDLAFLRERARALPPSGGPLFIWIESLHSMEGTLEDPQCWGQLCQELGAHLVVDEAHSFGLMGPQGSGWLGQHPALKKHTAVAMLGCGKALGVSGAFVVGPPLFLSALSHWAKPLIYTTGPSPFVVGALSQSLTLVRGAWGDQARSQLLHNWLYFQDMAQTLGTPHLSMHPGSPVLSLYCEPHEALRCARALLDQGFWVRPMRPPTVPTGTSRLRIVLHAQHTQSQIQKLLTVLHKEVS